MYLILINIMKLFSKFNILTLLCCVLSTMPTKAYDGVSWVNNQAF